MANEVDGVADAGDELMTDEVDGDGATVPQVGRSRVVQPNRALPPPDRPCPDQVHDHAPHPPSPPPHPARPGQVRDRATLYLRQLGGVAGGPEAVQPKLDVSWIGLERTLQDYLAADSTGRPFDIVSVCGGVGWGGRPLDTVSGVCVWCGGGALDNVSGGGGGVEGVGLRG